jgi:hypothetical protein
LRSWRATCPTLARFGSSDLKERRDHERLGLDTGALHRKQRGIESLLHIAGMTMHGDQDRSRA